MMRLRRKAALLVVLFLLTSAATAHAECAWVLWIETGTGSWPEGTGPCERSVAHIERASLC
jgi:hypothetical protein